MRVLNLQEETGGGGYGGGNGGNGGSYGGDMDGGNTGGNGGGNYGNNGGDVYRKRRQTDDERRMTDNGKHWIILNKVEKDIEEMFWQPARWVREEIFYHCPSMGEKLVSLLHKK